MLPILILVGLGLAAAAAASRSSAPRDAAPAPAPPAPPAVAANCGTLEQLEASPLGIFNRASVIAWAQCPERTAEEIEQLAARIDHEFQQAATDERALYYAQTRDQARAAFMRTHPSAAPPSSQR